MATDESRALRELIRTWEYDPYVTSRIEADVRRLRTYVDRRMEHEALAARGVRDQDERMAVTIADQDRTRAHNRAIRAADDLNLLCKAAGLEPIAPVCPEGSDPYARPHRLMVAAFVAEVLDLSASERAAGRFRQG